MNTIRLTLAALALSGFASAHASDATEFAVPTGTSLSRAEVVAETHRAMAAGELMQDEASMRVAAPAMSQTTREAVRMEAAEAAKQRTYGDRNVASLYFIGGM